MACRRLALALLAVVAVAAATPVRFDQRQNGSVNVQVDLKDLEVYAIMEDEALEGAMVGTDAWHGRPVLGEVTVNRSEDGGKNSSSVF